MPRRIFDTPPEPTSAEHLPSKRPVMRRPPTKLPRTVLLSGMSLLMVGVLLVGALLLFRPHQPRYLLKTWQTATVTPGTVVDHVTGDGVLNAVRQQDVLAPFEGTVTTAPLKEGQMYAKGTPLIGLQEPTWEAEEEELQMEHRGLLLELSLNEDRVKWARRVLQERQAMDLKRTSELNKKAKMDLELYRLGAIAQQDLRVSEQAVETARTEATTRQLVDRQTLQEAQYAVAALQQKVENNQRKQRELQRRKGRGMLVAGFTGTVDDLRVGVGQNLPKGEKLFRLIDPRVDRATLSLDTLKASQLHAAQPVNVRLQDGRTYPATLERISVLAQEGTSANTVSVTVRFDKVLTGLKPGTLVSGEVEVGRRKNVLTLPSGAYLASGGSQFVYVREGNTAVRRPVRLRTRAADQVEVLDGLKQGEQVLVTDYEAFKEFEKIELSTGGELP